MAVRAKKKQSLKSDEKKGNRRKIALWAGGILGVLAFGTLLVLAVMGPSTQPAELEPIDGLTTASDLSRDHVDDDHADDDHADDGHDEEIAVAGLPPMGGSHSAVWQNCGIYDEPIDAANAAHSLEHGAAWIAYQSDLPEKDVERLQNMARGERYLLLAPYPGLESPIVLTAWGVQLEVDSVRDDRISEFIDQYQQGPTTPEPGATCRDGVGTPIQ